MRHQPSMFAPENMEIPVIGSNFSKTEPNRRFTGLSARIIFPA
jgi:hypothetical protein